MPLTNSRRDSSASDSEPIRELELMDQGFKTTQYPLRVDLTGISHSIAPSIPETAGRSSRSTEFQTVLEGFKSLKLHQAKPEEIGKRKSIEENEERELLHLKRRNSIEFLPVNRVKQFRQPSLTARRASLPSLGRVVVGIQYSAPSRRKSGSYPENIGSGIEKSELDIIKEIPKEGRMNAGKPSRDFKETNASSLSNQLAGNTSFLRRRWFSLGAQRNINATAKSAFGAPSNQRRKCCCSRGVNNSGWCVKVHRRSLDINDDYDTLGPRTIKSTLANHRLYTRLSLPSISSLGSVSASTKYSILPRTGGSNSLVGERDE